jgi:hypothetical protein
MPQRNGYRSNKGRSAVARKVQFGGASGTNGVMPGVYVMTTGGNRMRTSYFGGPTKGGAAPSATGYMRASATSQSFQPSAPAQRPNYLFSFRQFSSPNASQPGAGGPLL